MTPSVEAELSAAERSLEDARGRLGSADLAAAGGGLREAVRALERLASVVVSLGPEERAVVAERMAWFERRLRQAETLHLHAGAFWDGWARLVVDSLEAGPAPGYDARAQLDILAAPTRVALEG